MNYINKGKRSILIFPNFKNMNKIQEVRKKYDELAELILPHITIAFPFNNNLSNEELKTKLQKIFKDIKPFKIKCKGIKLIKDYKIDTNYIFLNIIDGKDIIMKMHKMIYDKILRNIDISKYNYEPHITLGNTNDAEEKIILEEFETIIDKVVIERIGENEESIIEFEINL